MSSMEGRTAPAQALSWSGAN